MKIKYLAMAMVALLAVSCGNKKDASATSAEELPQVKLTTVRSQSVPQTEEYTATVESDIKNNIAPNVPYRIEKIYCEVGDKVRKGQLLVQLDASSLRQLKLQIENQNIEYSRTKALYEVGGASQAEFDAQQMQLNILNTQYKQMSQNTQLFAPISGVVTARNYDNGDMYGGQPILTIEETSKVKIICNISENHYKDIKVGQTVAIAIDAYDGEQFTGKVTIVSPSVDNTTHTFPVEVTINNSSQKVRPGMFARAKFDFGSLNHVVIPDEALVKQIGAGDRYVYVYNPSTQTVSYNKVDLGKHLHDTYEILAGVNSEDQIVIAGQSRLSNGKKVKVIK